MVGVGLAWASILAMPYAMLANSIPPKKMGMFMGLFNMSITIPQIVSGIASGFILKYIFNDNPLYCLVLAGCSLIVAALFSLIIKDIKTD
jgi:maltose/moltooligosaccharide transporter